ncbi:transcriptional regulator [Pseudoroseomonas deserti]|uniref:Transcriptional regulator n=1 Tax=Teichococcus deserti TaxID=1817963 RepID=A0A1V2GYT9_9PROT|nr:MurR/RpiR family transcriptional regulator [Pseudoroseomonas deserti]ONG50091.1 transcriptional regulator [Pseudoroseomonas deserti]
MAAPSAALFTGAIEKLRALRPSMPAKAGRIADFILEQPETVVTLSVTEVAEQCAVSEGSVIALCQSIGARGFQQLKLALAREVVVQPVQFIHEDLARDDDPATILKKMFGSGMQALQDTQKVLDLAQLEAAASALQAARRVEVYGIGSAAPVAEDAHIRLLRIGIEAKVVTDSHVMAISAAMAGPGVAVLTISHSGSTIETVAATKLAKEAGATTICLTNYGRSPLHSHADILLHTMARETRFRTEAMTSRIAQLAVMDTLIACLAMRRYDRSLQHLERVFEVLASKRL